MLQIVDEIGLRHKKLRSRQKLWHNPWLCPKKAGLFLPKSEALRVVRGVDSGPKTD